MGDNCLISSSCRVSPMSPSREIELKLEVPARNLPRLTAGSLLEIMIMRAEQKLKGPYRMSLVSVLHDWPRGG